MLLTREFWWEDAIWPLYWIVCFCNLFWIPGVSLPWFTSLFLWSTFTCFFWMKRTREMKILSPAFMKIASFDLHICLIGFWEIQNSPLELSPLEFESSGPLFSNFSYCYWEILCYSLNPEPWYLSTFLSFLCSENAWCYVFMCAFSHLLWRALVDSLNFNFL